MTNLPALPDDEDGSPEDKYTKFQMWSGVAAVASVALFAFYALNLGPARPWRDSFWTWMDGNLERLRALGGLIPAVVAIIAYRVYKSDREWKSSDRWWKRAEWALDTATDGDYARRTVGMTAMSELSALDISDREDRRFFNGLIIAVRDAEASRLPTANGPSADRIGAVDAKDPSRR
jgi:hypothetical protein